jgi:hypothetical protein
VWIERDDFAEVPPKGFFRLFPGNKVRLKYGMVIECTGCEKDAEGASPRCWPRVVPDTKSGTPGADAVKVKGTITWVGAHDALPAEVRLYDRLFTETSPRPAAATSARRAEPAQPAVVQGWLEPSLAGWQPSTRLQFERHGYFVADRKTTARRAGVQPHHRAEGQVLDVDLAGRLQPRRGDEIRVLNGRADWPRIKLRWTLSAGDRTLKSGEDDLSDMAYLQTFSGLDRSLSLPYEGRMLERWFAERVAGAR